MVWGTQSGGQVTAVQPISRRARVVLEFRVLFVTIETVRLYCFDILLTLVFHLVGEL
jgi:hypothetical protein